MSNQAVAKTDAGTVDGLPRTETRRSFCRICHAACPIDIDVEITPAGERLVDVHGVADDPLFGGYTCIKGRQLPDQLHHPARILRPLRRRPDGTFEEVTSAAAFDEIAAKVRALIDEHGPRSIATYVGTAGYQNSTGVATGRAFHQGIDSTSFYTSATIDQPAKSVAPFRLGAWEAGYHGFSNADVLLAIGYNPMVSSYGPVGGLQGTNPFQVLREAKQQGMKLIVVDPRRTELATQADIYLPIKPGEDATLLAGMIRMVLVGGLHDHEFCDQWVGDLDVLGRNVERFTPEYVADRCGIDQHDFEAAVRMFAAGPRGTAGTGTGPNMAPYPSVAEHLTMVLNTICGRTNREGDALESGQLLYPDAPKRAQVIAPRPPAAGPPARVRNLRGYRGEMPTGTLAEEILEPGDGQVRALFVIGGNPAVAWPDHALSMQALDSLELLVVVDHRMTASAESAHYVIAPTLSLERADVPHLMDRWLREPYTNWTDAVMTPPPDSDVVNEWEVYWEVASRIGSQLPYPGGSPSMDSASKPSTDEIIERAYAGSRMPVSEIKQHRGVTHPERRMIVAPADPDATARFCTAPEDLMQDLDAIYALRPDPNYPFRLTSRRLKHALNSLGPELPGLASKGITNHAYMNPLDMEDLGFGVDDVVSISSRFGTILGVMQPANELRRGVVSMAHSWGGRSLTDEKVREIGSPTSRLTSANQSFDPVTGMPVLSAIPIRLALHERAAESIAVPVAGV
jgi:anaerobic selenocysteine-containing dehydrogenase